MARRHGSVTPGGSASTPTRDAVRWIGERIGALRSRRAVGATVRPPARERLRPPRTRRLSAWWSARLAARAGVPIEDFLRHRLEQHLASLPVAPDRLPSTVVIEHGGDIVACAAGPTRPAPWLESFLRASGPSAIAPEIQLGQAEAARLAARIEGQRRRVDELTRDVEERTRGELLADPADAAEAEQLGRPAVPPPLGSALQAFVATLLVAETWHVGVPTLAAAGIDAARLPTELHRDPVALVLGAVLALGASASLLLLAHLALRRGSELLDAQSTTRRGWWTAAAAAGAVALGAALAWAVAGLRPSATHAIDLRYARATVFLVVLAVPFTAAWLLELARRLEQVRGEARARARAWDQAHFRVLADVARRSAALDEETERLRALEAERTATLRRVRALQLRASTAERLADEAAAREEDELARLAQWLLAALDRDRLDYARQVGRRAPDAPAPAHAAPLAVAPAVRQGRHDLGLAG